MYSVGLDAIFSECENEFFSNDKWGKYSPADVPSTFLM
jgi:hypothetical protein